MLAAYIFAIVLLRRIVKHLFRRDSVTFRQLFFISLAQLVKHNAQLSESREVEARGDKNRVNKNARSNIF